MMVTGMLADKGFHALDRKSKALAGHKIPQIWTVVADREQAYIYRKTVNGLELLAHAHAKGKQIESVDEHIFTPQSIPLQQHPTNPHYQKSYHLDVVFIRRLVEWLDVAEKEGAFDQLVLVAAPYTLGNLRASLTKGLQNRISSTLNKELTRMPATEIQKHLDKSRR